MNKLLVAAAAFGSMAFGATSAQAAKTFDLNGVKFTDGSTVTGSFTTNDAFTAITGYNITSNGSYGLTYTGSNGFATLSASSLSFNTIAFIFPQTLQLNLSKALSSAGASITGGSESVFIVSQSIANAGTVSLAAGAVPEPATWAMMILGLGVVGYAMRRKAGSVTTQVRFA